MTEHEGIDSLLDNYVLSESKVVATILPYRLDGTVQEKPYVSLQPIVNQVYERLSVMRSLYGQDEAWLG